MFTLPLAVYLCIMKNSEKFVFSFAVHSFRWSCLKFAIFYFCAWPLSCPHVAVSDTSGFAFLQVKLQGWLFHSPDHKFDWCWCAADLYGCGAFLLSHASADVEKNKCWRQDTPLELFNSLTQALSRDTLLVDRGSCLSLLSWSTFRKLSPATSVGGSFELGSHCERQKLEVEAALFPLHLQWALPVYSIKIDWDCGAVRSRSRSARTLQTPHAESDTQISVCLLIVSGSITVVSMCAMLLSPDCTLRRRLVCLAQPHEAIGSSSPGAFQANMIPMRGDLVTYLPIRF